MIMMENMLHDSFDTTVRPTAYLGSWKTLKIMIKVMGSHGI